MFFYLKRKKTHGEEFHCQECLKRRENTLQQPLVRVGVEQERKLNGILPDCVKGSTPSTVLVGLKSLHISNSSLYIFK